MPFGHEVSGATGKLPEVRAVQEMLGVKPAGAPSGTGGAAGGGGAGARRGVGYMERDLLGNVIPLVEKEYRVVRDPNHRAIVGYSMGAGQSSTIGLNHPELFACVGIFSGAAGESAISKALADPAKTNKDYKLVWVGCGTDDALINACRTFDRLLTDKGINHEYTESPGYRHDSRSGGSTCTPCFRSCSGNDAATSALWIWVGRASDISLSFVAETLNA